ncbi:MAG TPA: aminoacyl-tRNA hydrolase [Kiritimatiellia bacterium]|nr:aminoacyl-tRNA hydrolase [Kiritimatiellia bacterium]
MKLVAGLGNPGREYEHTPHNAGFDVVDRLSARLGTSLKRSWRFPAHLGEARVQGEAVQLVKPQTFMNRSGQAIAPLARKKGIGAESILVVVDDADLPLGKLRIRGQGGPGGHNGLKSIIALLGTDAFPRIRVGIGRGGAGQDMVGFVLGKMPPEQRAALNEALDRAAEAALCWLEQGLDRAMNSFNG